MTAEARFAPGTVGDPAVRTMAAMAFVRGISAKKSYVDAAAEGAEPRFTGTLAEWTKMYSGLTDDELGVASYAYMRTWNDVPLAAKKRRVEELSVLFDRLVARLARLEKTERATRKIVTKMNAALEAAGKPPTKVAPRHSAEWVRTAAEMRAILRDIALEMSEDKLLDRLADKLADTHATAAAGPEALRELRVLLDMETERLKAIAEAEDVDIKAAGDVPRVREPLDDKFVTHTEPVSNDVREPEDGVPL